MNGHVKEEKRSITPSTNLGKRKRSASPTKSPVKLLNGLDAHPPDPNIDNLIRQIKTFSKVASVLLQEPLPTKFAEGPSSKKARVEGDHDTIEHRLAANLYRQVDEIVRDFETAQAQVKERQTSEAKVKSEGLDVDIINGLLSQYSLTKPNDPRAATQVLLQSSDVLTVHSNVQGGRAQQLYTGLRLPSRSGGKPEEIDVTKLPNGFDVVEAAALGDTNPTTKQDTRTFGEVFRQGRRLKPLEQPTSSRGSRNTYLDFVQPYENLPLMNKEDYRHATLTTGLWLDYAAPGARLEKSGEVDMLFCKTFSSFAPTIDNTNSIVAPASKSMQWYRKRGQHKINAMRTRTESDIDFDESIYLDWDESENVSMEPIIEDTKQPIPDIDDDDRSVLEGVSDLLQTLSSYQRLRNLKFDPLFDENSKASEPEHSIYELLRDQLKAMISPLPPYAVAKLDGDQLSDLNISTSIQVSVPEYSGTGQPDDFTLEEQRRILRQNAAAARPVATVQPSTRNSYMSAGTPAASYSVQGRSYGTASTATPSMPGYAQRAAQQQMYNTPRPNAITQSNNYSQTPAYQARQPFPNATIQQFQRYQQNGITPSTHSVQTPYTQQRPQAPTSYQPQNQPSYGHLPAPPQYGRTNSTPSLTNGHIQHPPRQAYNQNSLYASTANLTNNPNATIQQVKAAQAQAQAQAHLTQTRQGSGTPQPKEILPRPASAMSGISTNSQGINGGGAGTPVSNTNTGA